MPFDSSHVQDTVRKEGREDIGDAHGRPKEGQPHSELMMLVEVREVQNDLAVSMSAFADAEHMRFYGQGRSGGTAHIRNESSLKDSQQTAADQE